MRLGIGVVGALIGALAGFGGAFLTAKLGVRTGRQREIREAAAELIALARHPAYVSEAVEFGLGGREEMVDLITRWGQDMARAHTKLVVVADDPVVVGHADLLWQRATDHLLALLHGPERAGEEAGTLEVVVGECIWELQASVAERYGGSSATIGRAID